MSVVLLVVYLNVGSLVQRYFCIMVSHNTRTRHQVPRVHVRMEVVIDPARHLTGIYTCLSISRALPYNTSTVYETTAVLLLILAYH